MSTPSASSSALRPSALQASPFSSSSALRAQHIPKNNELPTLTEDDKKIMKWTAIGGIFLGLGLGGAICTTLAVCVVTLSAAYAFIPIVIFIGIGVKLMYFPKTAANNESAVPHSALPTPHQPVTPIIPRSSPRDQERDEYKNNDTPDPRKTLLFQTPSTPLNTVSSELESQKLPRLDEEVIIEGGTPGSVSEEE